MNDEKDGLPRDESGASEPFIRYRTAADPHTGLIPGVDPAEVWEALEQIERGEWVSHAEVFARLRKRV